MGLPKVRTPQKIEEYRFICKSPVLQKWYLKSIVSAAACHRKPSLVQTYGFRKGRGPMLITELVRQLLFLSHEWGPRVFIASCDVKTAFDSMGHALIFRSLLARGIPEQLAVAIVWELCDVQANAEIIGIAAVEGISINSGGRQGGTETTWCWNMLMEFILEETVDTWNTFSMGFSFDDLGLVNHVIWADNLYLFASNRIELETMFNMTTKAIYEHNLRWKEAELQYIAGTNVDCTTHIEGTSPEGPVLLKFVEEMVVLGVKVDRRGTPGTSIEHNLTRAEGAYGSIAGMLRDKRVPMEERLKAWSRGPVGSAVYCAGGWALSKHNLHMLRRWEFNHIRSFLRMKRSSDEEGNFEFNRRTNKTIHDLFAKYAVDTIYVKALKMTFNWAKTWWEFRTDDGSGPLHAYMNCRPAATWEIRRSENEAWDYDSVSGWRHQHSGHRLQWEGLLNEALPEWRVILQQRPETWHRHRKRFLHKATDFCNLRTHGFKGFEEQGIQETSRRRKRKREGWEEAVGEDTSMVPCVQWQFASSIGGNLYNTMEQDSVWDQANTFELIADSETLVNILSGRAEPDNANKSIVSEILRDISDIMVDRNWGPRKITGDPVTWRSRGFNKEADYLANQAMDAKRGFRFTNEALMANSKSIKNIQGWSDGGCRVEEGVASYGWLLKAWTNGPNPTILACGSTYLERAATSSLEVEALAMREAAKTMKSTLLSMCSSLEVRKQSITDFSRKLYRQC